MSMHADTAAIPIADAHCHVWDLSLGKHPWLAPGALHPHRYGDYSAAKQDFLPVDYRAATAPYRVHAAVHMEAEWTPDDPLGEARWIADLNAKTGFPAAMTAQAWLAAPDAGDLIAAQAAFPLVRSIRQKPKAFATAQDWAPGHDLTGSMNCPTFRRGYGALAAHGLHFELQTPYWHLPDAARLAADFPDTVIVVNHAGVPGAGDRATLDAWRAALAQAAAQPNVRVKVGGLGMHGAPLPPEARREIVLTCIELFGADRVMFASNMPIDGLFFSFRELIAEAFEITAALSDADRRAFFAGTAAQTYGLNLPAQT